MLDIHAVFGTSSNNSSLGEPLAELYARYDRLHSDNPLVIDSREALEKKRRLEEQIRFNPSAAQERIVSLQREEREERKALTAAVIKLLAAGSVNQGGCAGDNDSPIGEATKHVGPGLTGNRADSVTALICWGFEVLGQGANREAVIGFLRQAKGLAGSVILEERADGFLIEVIDGEEGAMAKVLTWKEIGQRINRLRTCLRSNPNYISDRAARVPLALRKVARP